MRTIFAMGGGGFTMEPDNPVLDEYILGLARRPVPRVCFLPTASGDPLDHITRFYEAFSDMPCEPTDLSLFRLGRRPVDLRTLLHAQDIVYVGGGSMRNMLAIWRGRRPRAAPRLALRALRRRAGAAAGVPRGRGVGCGPRGLRSRRRCRAVVSRRPAGARRVLAPRGRLRTREARRRPGRRGAEWTRTCASSARPAVDRYEEEYEMPAFRVEVTGVWRDLALQTDEPHSQVFSVSAPGPLSAQVAGLQLFGGEAARRRCLALPGPDARVLSDAAP